MKRNVIFLFFVVSVLFCTKNSYAQVLQKKADKWQLINGVKLGPGVKKQNLNSKKVNTSSVLIKSNKIVTLEKINIRLSNHQNL